MPPLWLDIHDTSGYLECVSNTRPAAPRPSTRDSHRRSYLPECPTACLLPPGRSTPEAEIVVDYPSRLADDLAEGRLDVAMIPSIEYFLQPGYRLFPMLALLAVGRSSA